MENKVVQSKENTPNSVVDKCFDNMTIKKKLEADTTA
jgi:hypothetical protein